ncbi:MAG: penicillin-binding protein 1C [Fretibacterium sp.]|nr:penicillin-binding protein 1C [Fretibacterium sp.]
MSSKILKGITMLLLLFLMLTGAGFVMLWTSLPLEVERVTHIEASPALYDSEGYLFHLRLSPDSEWQVPISLADMGKWLPRVVVAVEDGRFYSHPGVDPLALLRATVQNLTSGHIVSGASTLTSQLIRLSISEREPVPGSSRHTRRPRSIVTKVREFVLALKLERVLSKEEILEYYLNRAPFGGNIRGVQAAALIYFGKQASQLSPGEACLLIGMLKGPTLYRPDTQPEAARERRDAIIRLMENKGVFTHNEAQRALLEGLPNRRTPPPFRAYHFSELVMEGRTQTELSAGLRTTLRLDIQSRLESILRQAARELPANITLAAGIVENRTANLVAWMGNARFGEGSTGWVDCGRAPRSPGSTLKPFAYLSAVDQGYLTASSLLADTSIAFSGRAPRNFDLLYRGAVTARVALSESLNAPAVRVLRMAGADRILRLLKDVGLHHLTQPASYYGDSLILGGCEVTLLEELEAFAALASLGLHRPLSLLKGQLPPENHIASEAGCWLICDILNHRGPLSLLTRGTIGQKWQVALKTGTSYGLRDAWTAAWTPDFTAVVWVGAPEGESWPGLIGARTAAPVALRILRAVSPHSSWYNKPKGLVLRKVCTLSGRTPTAACPSTQLDWALEGITRTTPCTMHTLRQGHTTVIWPTELRTAVPPSTSFSPQQGPLTITSPIAGATYLTAPFDLQRRLPMRAEGAAEQVWWYLDGRYIGTSLPNETFFHPVSDGTHIIGATDKEGRSTSTTVRVATPGRSEEPQPLN